MMRYLLFATDGNNYPAGWHEHYVGAFQTVCQAMQFWEYPDSPQRRAYDKNVEYCKEMGYVAPQVYIKDCVGWGTIWDPERHVELGEVGYYIEQERKRQEFRDSIKGETERSRVWWYKTIGPKRERFYNEIDIDIPDDAVYAWRYLIYWLQYGIWW